MEKIGKTNKECEYSSDVRYTFMGTMFILDMI